LEATSANLGGKQRWRSETANRVDCTATKFCFNFIKSCDTCFFWIQHFYCATNLVLRHGGQGPMSTGGMWAKFAIVTHIFPKEHCQDTKTLYSVSGHRVKDPSIFRPFITELCHCHGVTSSWKLHLQEYLLCNYNVIKSSSFPCAQFILLHHLWTLGPYLA